MSIGNTVNTASFNEQVMAKAELIADNQSDCVLSQNLPEEDDNLKQKSEKKKPPL